MSGTDPRPSCLLPRCRVAGEVKYVRLASGEIRFVDPLSAAAHYDAVTDQERREDLYSAGRVVVDRAQRTVSMADRDSFSLGIKSAPGDEDAEAVREFLFDHWPASKSAAVA